MRKSKPIQVDDDIILTQINPLGGIPDKDFDTEMLAEVMAENPFKYEIEVKFEAIKELLEEAKEFINDYEEIDISVMQLFSKKEMIKHLEQKILEGIGYMLDDTFNGMDIDVDMNVAKKCFKKEIQEAQEKARLKAIREKEERERILLERAAEIEKQERKQMEALMKKYNVAKIPSKGVTINIPKKSFDKAKKKLDEAGVKYSK